MSDAPDTLTRLTGDRLRDMIAQALRARAAVRHAVELLSVFGGPDEHKELLASVEGLRAHLDVQADRLCSFSDPQAVSAAEALVPTGPVDLETHVCTLLLRALRILADLADAVEDHTGVVPVDDDGEFRFSQELRQADSQEVAGAYVRACTLLGGAPAVDDI